MVLGHVRMGEKGLIIGFSPSIMGRDRDFHEPGVYKGVGGIGGNTREKET